MVDTLVLYFHVHIWISFVLSVGDLISFEVLFAIHAWPSASVYVSMCTCCILAACQFTVLFTKLCVFMTQLVLTFALRVCPPAAYQPL